MTMEPAKAAITRDPVLVDLAIAAATLAHETGSFSRSCDFEV